MCVCVLSVSVRVRARAYALGMHRRRGWQLWEVSSDKDGHVAASKVMVLTGHRKEITSVCFRLVRARADPAWTDPAWADPAWTDPASG